MKNAPVILIAALVLALTAQAGTLKRNETVYVDLNHQGTPRKTTVVTWLKTDGRSPAVDYNRVTEVVNVKGTVSPEISGDRLRFASEAPHIFYRGQTERSLPLSLEIEYTLDGEPAAAADLEGKSGRITVTVSIKNGTAKEASLSYRPLGAQEPQTITDVLQVPFVVMISLDLPLRQYSNIRTPDGVLAVVGETFKLKWVVMPWPESRITLTADAENISLPAFLITASPRMIPLPEEVSQIRPQLERVYEGIDRLSHYLGKLQDGAAKVAEGNRRVYDNLAESPEQYARVVEALDAQTKLVSSVQRINASIREKIALGEWLPVIDQMNTALEVENQLLNLLQEGGPFSEQVLSFIEKHEQQKPPLDHFPANIAHLTEKFEQTRKELQTEKLPRLKKLRDGSQKLAEGVRRIRHEGAEEIKQRLRKKSDPLLRKLAVLDRAKQMAAEYDRFTGVKPDGETEGPPSAVQFIMKTPGKVVP